MCRSHRGLFFAAFLAICATLFTFGTARASTAAATGTTTGAAASSATDTVSSNGSAVTGDVDEARLEQLQSNQTLELAVVVNGSPTGKIGEFVAHGNSLFARGEELTRLGFQLPDPPAANGLVLLTGVSGLTTRIDQGTQTLYVLASPEFIAPTVVGDRPADDYAIESGSGAVLNYDVVGTSADGKRDASGLFDARVFSRYGVVSSGLLVNTSPNRNRDGAGNAQAVRLDTTHVFSDPRTVRRYRLRDFLPGRLPWT